jgi:hypothetical protein
MAETTTTLVLGVFVGVAATVTMDVLATMSRKVGLVVGAKGIWVGRWYLGMARGRFAYSDITTTPEIPGEKRAALVGHYVIGVVLAIIYLFGARWLGLAPSSFFVAGGYGLATCVFPWFLLLPAMGFGVFGSKGPPELKLFTSSLVNHLYYGIGLWWSAWVVRFLTT